MINVICEAVTPWYGQRLHYPPMLLVMLRMDPEGVVGGSEGLDPLEKLEVVIGFLRNTGMDPLLETIGRIVSRLRFVWHAVKYIDD